MVGEEGEGRQKSCPAPSQDFRLPGKNEDNEKIIKYLTEKREIEKKLVEEWIDRGDIYEEKMVFQDMHTAGERIISCLYLKQLLIGIHVHV